MGTATISFGPKLGLLNNAAIGQKYYDQFRLLLQAVDQLIMGSVINATTSTPPLSPSNGNAYLLTGGTPSGAWTGQAGNIAVWDTQVTNAGTNTLAPAWVFYTPKAGWTLWNVATASYNLYNGSSWAAVAGGADFPVNTDITSMTGIANTTLDGSGYTYNAGSSNQVVVDTNGVLFGPAYNTGGGGTTNTVQIANQVWDGAGYTGPAVGVSSPTGTTVVGAGFVGGQSASFTDMNILNLLNVETSLAVGASGIISFAPDITIPIGAKGIASNPISVLFTGAGSGLGLIGFGTSGTHYGTQTTVGSAGAASALPATPTGYLQIYVNGTEQLIPYYHV